MHASNEGHFAAVKLLLSYGAELGLQDTDGMQAIHFAAEAASAECFRVLFEAGADPLAMDNFDRSALECLPPLLMTSSDSAKQEWQAVFQEVKMVVPATLASAGIEMDEGDEFCGNSVTLSQGVTQVLGHEDEQAKEIFTPTARSGAQSATDAAMATPQEQHGEMEIGGEAAGQMSVGSASTTADFSCEEDASVATEGCSGAPRLQ